MPNWCSNVLTVKTENLDQIRELIHRIDKEQNLINFFIPMPQELEDTVKSSSEPENPELLEKYGADNWYDWQRENWGIKWGDCDTTYVYDKEHSPNTITFNFQTPWGPSLQLYNAMREAGFQACMYWCEFGMMFCGCAINGILSEYDIDESNNDCATYNEIDETFGMHEMLDNQEASY